MGTTIDDAMGEAFDKTAKLLGLPYPGGPELERAAAKGDPASHALPRPMVGKPGCDFSFSGLKTAVAQVVTRLGHAPNKKEAADVAASFQAAITESVARRTRVALETFAAVHPGASHLVVAGGVAANRVLRAALEKVAAAHGFTLVAPPAALCSDNAAMVAWAGIERLRLGLTDPLDFRPRPRWALGEVSGVE
jgi:N6-L-threonylcarbamoyladenine synthase